LAECRGTQYSLQTIILPDPLLILDVQESGECQHAAPVNVSKHAESGQRRKSGAKISAKNVFQRKGKEVSDAEPREVAERADATDLLKEDQHVDEGRRFRRRTQVAEDESFQDDSQQCGSNTDNTK